MATLFLNGLVLDGLGGAVEGGGVLVEGERIAAVGRGLEAHRSDPDTAVVDLAGRTVMPGLIDCHVHFVGGDYFPGYEEQPVGLAVLRSAAAIKRTLEAGYTTVRTAASRDFLDVDLRDAVNQGLVPGPRILASGRGITCTGGHIHDTCIEADGPDEIRKAVRLHVKRRCNSLKLVMSAGVATDGLPISAEQFTVEEAATAVYEAHRSGLRVLTHSISRQAIANAVEAGVDSIDHGHYLDEELALKMKARGIYLVPTFGPMYYYTEVRQAEQWRIDRAEAVQPRHAAAFRLALETGVPIAAGSDCGAPSRFPNGENGLELWLMARYGMAPERVIRAGTADAARLIGLDQQLGSLEPGKLADLIVLDGNPLDDIRLTRTGVRYVMKGGAVARDELER